MEKGQKTPRFTVVAIRGALMAGIAFRAAGKSVRNFPAASKFAENFSSKEFQTATAFSSFLELSLSFS